MSQVNNHFGDLPGGRDWQRLMRNEGYDLSKFELVAVPEEFSDASGTDQIGHGGLLEYDGVLDVEGYGESDESEEEGDPGEGFNVTIEHVGDDVDHESGFIHLLEVPEHNSLQQPHYHRDDVLDIGIEACDLNSLLEQFEECEQPKKPVDPRSQKPKDIVPQDRDPIRKEIITPVKELPNPADIIKKIVPIKRKATILLESDALPVKKTKPKHTEVIKAMDIARKTDASSPIPFNLKTLIPTPKYLSMEHDYCLSPAQSEKSNASDLGSHMSKEQRRAYYKNKYKVKKKDGLDSPAKYSSVSSSPASMSPASTSPNPAVNDGSEAASKGPIAVVANAEPVVPLFDKIPSYFSNKLLVGMYREIDSGNPNQAVHQGFDQNIFVQNNNNEATRKKRDDPQSGQERKSRSHFRQRRRRSYRKSNRNRKNSLSSQSDSSCCSSCSDQQERQNDTASMNQSDKPNRRRLQTRASICSARSRSASRSRSRSSSYSSRSSCDSRGYTRSRSFSHSRSRSRSRSFSRSRSRSFSRSPSYSRSRSRTHSRSCSSSRSRSRDYSRRSRSYSRSVSRSPYRNRRSSSRRLPRSSHSRSRTRSSQSRSRGRSQQRRCDSSSRSRFRSFDPNAGNKEVKYTEEQLQEFGERRVVYVGNISRDTTKQELMRQFSRFGQLDKIQLYFRENQDSYGFVTFHYKCDAVAAIEAGNDDPNWPKYDLCFGGRRKFCMSKYEDLDSLNKASSSLDFGYHGDAGIAEDAPAAEESEFDKLLKAAMKTSQKQR